MDKQKDFEKGWEEYKAKKKQEIEEMYQDFLNFKFQNSSPETFSYKGLVEHLHRAGYRKIPKNAVVLTREEYEKLKQYEEKVKSGACFTQKEWLELCDEECKRNTENLSKARQLERKETAWKFAERLNNKWKQLELGGWVECPIETMNEVVDEICKEITDKEVQNGN